ncbi:MAG: hypothetical protein J0M04_09125 [Verrucomicrobia bacterium]|nr:hypothetical protein [Verrucomicrobiota bacterium]
MERKIRTSLAALLAAGALLVGIMPGACPAAPISEELVRGSPAAVVVFSALAALLGYYWWHCRRIGWKGLSWSAAGIALLLPLLATTPPGSNYHLAAFVSLLATGIVWLIVYAAKDSQMLVSSLVILLIVIGAILAFVTGVRGNFVEAAAISPLGFFQKGFLIVFSVLAIRKPNTPVPQPGPRGGE